MLKQLIVNADDYGHTSGISLGIRQAHLNGIVTSTSAMMNRPTAREAIQIAQEECPKLGLGLHLVLTTGKPLLPAGEVGSLVDSEGNFHRLAALLDRCNEINLTEVNREWHAQVAAFRAIAGCNPDHLDSHHHSSYFSTALFQLMLNLTDELDCPIRLPWGLEETVLAEQLSQTDGERSHRRCPQVFFSDFYDDGVSLPHLKSIIENIASDSEHSLFELMCHPAVVDDEVRQITSYNDQRATELMLLQSQEIKSLLKWHDIQLIRFSDIQEEER